jgi:H/ACA ribonucleoprotein complex subunit 3
MNKINFCVACERYTMDDSCPKCGVKAPQAKPAKYSPEDRWGDYRRRAKAEMKPNAFSDDSSE